MSLDIRFSERAQIGNNSPNLRLSVGHACARHGTLRRFSMNGFIYLIGLLVVIMAVLSLLGLR
jgi:hypothetical protein